MDRGLTPRGPAMEVHLDSEEAAMARRDRKGKRRRPQGRIAAAAAAVAAQTGRVLAEREVDWLDASPATRPASLPSSARSTTRRGTRPISMSPASWPRPANVPRWLSTSPR